jgi:hypothetical protein
MLQCVLAYKVRNLSNPRHLSVCFAKYTFSCRDDNLGVSGVRGIGSERGGHVAVQLVTSHALAYARSEDRPRAAAIPLFFWMLRIRRQQIDSHAASP